MHWQQPIPRSYTQLPTEEMLARIDARKRQLGGSLVILGHHYQQDDVIRFADIVGDSFHLSREAAKLDKARYVVFCGVHFMAESADILTSDHQQVILPDLGAGCSMADMASLEDVQDAWQIIQDACRDIADFTLVPITYINSTAAIKSFVGEHGGTVCTSSNCEKILRWALNLSDGPLENQKSKFENRKVIFFPDQHLGRNTAFKMGFPLSEMVVWNYREPGGGLTDEEIRNARFILWKGHCSVHQLFRPEHVDQARAKHPGIKVIVHPECRFEVVQKADLAGSTEFIGRTIAAAAPGSAWSVGTEVHMVNRLAKQFPDRHISILSDCQCLCTTMYRIDPPHLLWTLDNLAEGKVVNQIIVDEKTKEWSRVALNRMLEITAGKSPVVTPAPARTRREHDPLHVLR